MAFETTTDEVIAGVDLSDRVALVTGANSGLGLETARALASAGAHVVLAARDEAKGKETASEISSRLPGASLEYGVLELDSLASVRSFADWFLSSHAKLDLLINNAGVMATPFARTVDGFERQFGTNHLGHFLLTNLLLPAVLAAAPARIVNLSSAGHRNSDVDFDDPNFERREYSEWPAYGQSKTANILFSVELDRRLASKGVRAYAVHPGVIMTNLSRYLTESVVKDLMVRVEERTKGAGLQMKTVEQGAATSVWAAVAPELADVGGVYLEDVAISEPEPYALNPDSAKRLWSLSEQLVGATFPES